MHHRPVLAVICLLLLSALAAAGDWVTVEIKGGRRLIGQVHSRTDGDRLWLLFGDERVRVLRPLQWGEIEAAEHGGRPIEPAEMQAALLALRDAEPGQPPPQVVERRAAAAIPLTTGAERARGALGLTSKVRSVTADAFVAHWDADAESDGIVVQLAPLDVHGSLVAAGGTVEVELIAATHYDREGVQFDDRPRTVARWSRRVSAEDIGAGGFVLRLNFPFPPLQRTRALSEFGLVHVRFVAPGHGVFEYIDDFVPLRGYSPLEGSR